MRVRFSPDIFRIERFGGVSRYITEVHGGLLAEGVDSRILAGLHRNEYLAHTERVLGWSIDGLRPVRLRQAVSKVADRALERVWAAGQDRATIYHKSYFDRAVPTGPTLAVTVYDMIHERYPEAVGPRDRTVEAKRRWCEAADVVFAISSQTRDDLLERYGLDPARVRVTHLGVSTTPPDGCPPGTGGRPFVLYVGDRSRPYKNWPTLVDAVDRLPVEVCLVCFGPPASAGELALLHERRLSDRVVFAGGDDAALASAYASAAVLAYPSRYEGFGLPPLEAMAHGCPVVAGRAGSLPEVLGDAAWLVDPDDVDALAHALATVVDGGPDAERLRSAGPARAATYTWTATVDATLEGYRAALA